MYRVTNALVRSNEMPHYPLLYRIYRCHDDDDPDERKSYTVLEMELADDTLLKTLVSADSLPGGAKELYDKLFQVLLAHYYLYRYGGFLHGDLKGDNILLLHGYEDPYVKYSLSPDLFSIPSASARGEKETKTALQSLKLCVPTYGSLVLLADFGRSMPVDANRLVMQPLELQKQDAKKNPLWDYLRLIVFLQKNLALLSKSTDRVVDDYLQVLQHIEAKIDTARSAADLLQSLVLDRYSTSCNETRTRPKHIEDNANAR